MVALVVVGACYLDTILSVPHYPQEDEKLRAVNLARRRGGNGPNTLEVLEQLLETSADRENTSLHLCSVLPAKDSHATQLIQASFGQRVDFTRCLYRANYQEAASSYIIRSIVSGTRTLVNYNSLPEMSGAELIAMAHRNSFEHAWYHFEGRVPDAVLDCIGHLRSTQPGTKVSVEIEKPGRPGLKNLVAEADVVFISRSWAENEGYPNAKSCLRDVALYAAKAHLVCCTWGECGASALELPTTSYHELAALQTSTTQVVDTVGAGDTFIAGMLFGLICRAQWSLGEKLDFANRIAGHKVRQEGFQGLGSIMLGQKNSNN